MTSAIQSAAFERAVQQGLVSVAKPAVLAGPAVATGDRPARFGRSGARAKAAAAGGAFRSPVPGISDADARANVLAARIRCATPFGCSAADKARIAREVTVAFDREFA